MPIHRLNLTGCAPRPLAAYLKALGVLRVVAEQIDPGVRGWWQDDGFWLLTACDRQALTGFFLSQYRPTPCVAPWNKGSGFYVDSQQVLAAFERSRASRFEPLTAAIAQARGLLQKLQQVDNLIRQLKGQIRQLQRLRNPSPAQRQLLETQKQQLAAADRRFKALKADLFTPCARAWRGPHRQWFDAALVLLDDGSPAFAPLLGTGGNDGRLDFTYNALQRLLELFDPADPQGRARPPAAAWLEQSLWGGPAPGLLVGPPVGQFLPGQAGGANGDTGFNADSLVNPWDFVLTLEGSLLFGVRATRRLDPAAVAEASAPFVVRPQPCGYASAGAEAARAEQWMPLWSQPATAAEVAALLGEGRMQVRRTLASRPIDAARAIAALGTARGIVAFERYAFLERNGQANLAVPLGRIAVRERPAASLVDDLALWLTRLHRAAAEAIAPARLRHAERQLADAVFAVLTHDPSPDRWQGVLLAAQAVEAVQAGGTACEVGPIPPLSPEWLAVADDGSPEWRLAQALGSAAAAWVGGEPVDPVRVHWLPWDPRQPRRYRLQGDGQRQRLVRHPRVVALGRDPVADAGALVERRVLEAAAVGRRCLPLVAAPGRAAAWGDLVALLAGAVDLERTMRLAQALMAIDWRRVRRPSVPSGPCRPLPEEAWLVLRCCCLAEPLPDGRRIPCDPALVRRLRSGDAAEAIAIGLRRLRASGIRPPLQAGAAAHALARRWLAALAFPITPLMAGEAVAALHPQPEGAAP